MRDDSHIKLKHLGLSNTEGAVYGTLVRSRRPLGASAIAAAMGLTRTNIYPVLKALGEKGMIENGEGYGSQFAALPPEEALPRLIAAEREKLLERESLAADLIKEFQLKADPIQSAPETKLIEVIRDQRVANDRFQKLQHDAEREIDALVRPPMFRLSKNTKSNPAESQSLRRGVRHRAIYQSSVLDHENIGPYLKSWIEAGEEARVYKGNLPLKLILFDSKIAWMPLETNAQLHPIVSVLIRHHALAQALRLLFDYLWKESEPIRFGQKRARKHKSKSATAQLKK